MATSSSSASLDSREPTPVSRERRYDSHGQTYTLRWKDYGQSLPSWFDRLMQGFVDALALPADWDSYGAPRIETGIVYLALNFAQETLSETSPAPRVVPLSSGGLQLEWHRHGIELELVFDRNDEPFFYYRNRLTGEEFEDSLLSNRALLAEMLAKFD